MPVSTAEVNKMIDALTGRASTYAKPTATYVGLSSTTPTNTGGNVTEPSPANGYARIQVLSSEFDLAANRATQNNAVKSFAVATSTGYGGGVSLTYMVAYDHVTTTTNFLWFAPLSPSRVVAGGDTPKIQVGDLDLIFS